MKKLVIVLLFLTASPAFAQHGRNGYTGFSLITPLEISGGEDTNFLVNRVTPDEKLLVLSLPGTVIPAAPDLRPSRLSDNVLLLKAPTLAYLDDTERQELSIRYQPEVELFFTNKDQNALNNNLAIDYRSEEHTSELQSRLHLVCR